MIILATALAVFQLQNSVFGFRNLTVRHPQISCELPRKEEEDHLWGSYTCECGPHCVRHATCCQDSPHVKNTRETCQSMPPFFSEHVILVWSCSDRWQHEHHVRDMCEGPEKNSHSERPVTSRDTGVTYRNKFCAICNYDCQALKPWDVVFQRLDMSNSDFSDWTTDKLLKHLVYDNESNTFRSPTDPDGITRARWLFRVPKDLLKVVKKCHPHIVSDCDASRASDHELRSRCLSYYTPVDLEVNGVITKYRNVHCALCNSISGEENSIC